MSCKRGKINKDWEIQTDTTRTCASETERVTERGKYREGERTLDTGRYR